MWQSGVLVLAQVAGGWLWGDIASKTFSSRSSDIKGKNMQGNAI